MASLGGRRERSASRPPIASAVYCRPRRRTCVSPSRSLEAHRWLRLPSRAERALLTSTFRAYMRKGLLAHQLYCAAARFARRLYARTRPALATSRKPSLRPPARTLDARTPTDAASARTRLPRTPHRSLLTR
ncbi:hypothetical protein OBBRIDRAFT_117501 [Obba rivulosa]|uniref:Uncharacterized protein n=1 Tax=Obba rivulosa TaxID=1052685 RepID=A0A8E2DH99_9APHY|nr:hypothetical protein OBBRIDRAFT_117501 [Obba rivulosa]